MTPMKIAIIVGKMDSGGKKNLIMEYYRHIDRDKIQFDFICDSDSQAIPEQEILELGGNVYKISPYQHIVRNMADMAHIFQQNKYKVVHAYNSTMNLFPMAVAKYCNVPVRISESLSMAHEGDWKTILKKILRPMSRLYANYYMSCGEDCGRWQFGNKLFDTGKVDVFKTVINTEFEAYEILDPTLQMNGDFWRSLCKEARKVEGDYVLLIQLNRNVEFDKYAKSFCNQKGIRLVRLCLRVDQVVLPGKAVVIPEVNDYIRLIRDATYVLTDSFHAVSFCLNLEKQFYVYYPNKYAERLKSILLIMELTDRELMNNDYDTNIDYKKVNKILMKKRKLAKDLMLKVLDKGI